MGIRTSRLALPVVLAGLMAGLLFAPQAAAGPAAPPAAGGLRAAPVVPVDTTAGYLVYDRTARRIVAESAATTRFRSASLVKLLIALDYLQGRTSVSAGDRKMLDSMLRSSDDAAASTLWVRRGYEQVVVRMVRLIGLVDTAPPTDRRYWGYTAVSAADVVPDLQLPPGPRHAVRPQPHPRRPRALHAVRGRRVRPVLRHPSRRLRDPRGEAGLVGLRIGAGEAVCRGTRDEPARPRVPPGC